MTDVGVVISVQEAGNDVPADENTNSVTEMSTQENVATKALPLLRVEELKEDVNSNFSYTSGEEEHGSHNEASDDPDRKDIEEEEFNPPSEELQERIIKQVEFYFSDANILKDAFLLKHVRRNKQGYVSLKLITSFKKMKSLTKDYRDVAFSLRKSNELEVNEEGKKVRRKNPLPEFDETTPSRSVVVINLPMESPSIENVAEMFSKCGEVSLIRILRPGKTIPQDVKKHASKHPEIGTSVCAVVEFEKHEHAKKAVDIMSDKDDWKKGMRVVILAETKKKQDKNNEKKNGEKPEEAEDKDGEKRKKKRGGRKHKNKYLDPTQNDESSCYSSGSEYDPPSRQLASTSLSPQFDGNRLSPGNSPRSSPRSSPMTSPRSQRRRMGPHGKSPLAEHSPNGSPRPSPRSSPESSRKRYDYSSGGDSTPSSPWVQRRLKAAQEINKSPLAVSPHGSPMVGRSRMADMEGVVRQPKGPDGTRGFHLGRGKPRASTFS